MNASECIEALEILLKCMDDKLQGERDKMTKLIDLKPSSFEFVLKSAINLLCETQKTEHDNYSELFQAARVLAEHCEMTICRDCPFNRRVNDCALHTDVPFLWYDWLPEAREERNDE